MPPAPSTPPDWLDPVLGILTRYVSLPTAQSIVKHARQRARITSTHIDRVQLGALLEPLQRALSVFLADPVKAAKCRADLIALVDGPAMDPESGPVSLRRRSLVI